MTENKHAIYLSNLPIPPSTNHLYTTNSFGGRTLSILAKVYKRDIVDTVVSLLLNSRISPLKDTPYGLRLVYFMPHLLNRTKRAKHRFKKVDVENRQKVLIDALFEGFGIDDCCLFHLEARKVALTGEEEPYVTAYLYPLHDYFIYDAADAAASVRRPSGEERLDT